MAYELGTASTPNELLDKMRLFLAANGWTVDNWSDLGSSKRLHVHKGSIHISMRTANNEYVFDEMGQSGQSYPYYIALVPCTGYDGGEAWNNQPGSSTRTATGKVIGCLFIVPQDGVTAYYFFADDSPVSYFHCWVKMPQLPDWGSVETWYQWCSFGEIHKSDYWAGGNYCAASRPSYYGVFNAKDYATRFTYTRAIFCEYVMTDHYSGSAYARIDGEKGVNGWATNGANIYRYAAWSYGKHMVSNVPEGGGRGSVTFSGDLPNFYWQKETLLSTFSGVAILQPVELFWYPYPDDTGNFVPMGQIPNMLFTRITSFNPGEEIEFGGKTYLVLPWTHVAPFDADPTVVGALIEKVV